MAGIFGSPIVYNQPYRSVPSNDFVKVNHFTTADFDGDGNLDIVVTGVGAADSELSIAFGIGNGNFGRFQDIRGVSDFRFGYTYIPNPRII
tara:strand:+ start:290 stop:562 length:273 start_codon:yes stop_codon:yes gene_type:complete